MREREPESQRVKERESAWRREGGDKVEERYRDVIQLECIVSISMINTGIETMDSLQKIPISLSSLFKYLCSVQLFLIFKILSFLFIHTILNSEFHILHTFVIS